MDFKLKHINEEQQRELLLPLVSAIQNRAKDKVDQFRIAVSLVQHIDFGFSGEIVSLIGDKSLNYSRYPYEVLYDMQGVCGEKSELLAFLLREIGYDVVLFYHAEENHESLGVKCPLEYSVSDSGYCFVETSAPSIITDNEIEYVGGLRLNSEPEIMLISEGISLEDNLPEYKDAQDFIKIRRSLKQGKKLDFSESEKLDELIKKYGLVEIYGV